MSRQVEAALREDAPKVERRSGANRFATAAEVARTQLPDADTGYVANGRGFADALAGNPAAIADRAPILLVEPDAVPAATSDRLKAACPSSITILGGPSAVSARVQQELTGLICP